MQRTLKKLVFLFALVCTVICCVAFAACGDKNNGGGNKITYSVTVSSDDASLTLTSITAQWKSGSEVKGSAALDSEGKASVKLDKGDYTVDLSGELDGYTWSTKNVTAASPSTTITITKVIANSKTLNVQVTSALPLPANAKVQVYDADDAEFGATQAIQTGNNALSVPKTGDFTIVFVDGEYLEGEVEVAATALTATLNLTAKEVEYTVTVEAEAGINLVGVTVALKADSNEVATKNIVEEDIVEGVATIIITAPAGEYTVELENLDPANEYASETVSYESTARTATIEVKATVYIVTLDKLGNSIDESALTVELYDDAGEKVAEATFEDGVAKFYVAAGDYTIDVKGLVGYGYIAEDFNADKEATVHVAAIPEGGSQYLTDDYDEETDSIIPSAGTPYTLNAVGGYYIEFEVEYRGYTFKFTAPEEGENLYTFSWKYLAENDTVSKSYGYGTNVYSEIDGVSISFILQKEEIAEFALQYSPESFGAGSYRFIIEVAAVAAPALGSVDRPVEIASSDLADEHTGPEGRTDVYFQLAQSGRAQSFTITFDEGATVYYSNDNIADLSEIASGDIIIVPPYSDGFIRVVADSAPVKFTLKRYFAPGANPEKPYAIPGIGVNVSYNFIDGSPAWFTFTPEQSGYYRIVEVQDVAEIYVTSGPFKESWDGEWVYDGETLIGGLNDRLSLTGGTKYYIYLGANDGNESIFKIIEYVAVDGEIGKPIEVHDGENTAENLSYNNIYYVYTATADGVLKFQFAENFGSTYVTFYTDADYSDSSAYNDDNLYLGSDYEDFWRPDGNYCQVKAGDKVYFTISSYDFSSVTFTISIRTNTNEAPAEVDLKLGKKTEVKVTPTVSQVTLNLVDVPEGAYELSYEIEGTASATITFTAQESVVTVSGISGWGPIDIQQGTDTIILKAEGLASVIFVNVTIKELVGLKVGADETYTATFKIEDGIFDEKVNLIGVAPGEYTLSFGSADVYAKFNIDAGANHAEIGDDEMSFAAGSVNITIPEGCNSLRIYNTNYVAPGTFKITMALTAGHDNPVEILPEAFLSVDVAYELEVSEGYDGIHVNIPLMDVPAGKYELKLESDTELGLLIYADADGNEATFGTSGLFGTDPYTVFTVTIVIPEGCTSIALTGNGYVPNATITFTLTEKVEPLEVGGSVRVKVPAFSGAGVNVQLASSVTGGEYTITINESEENNVTIYIDDEPYTFGSLEGGFTKTVNIPAGTQYILVGSTYYDINCTISLSAA